MKKIVKITLLAICLIIFIFFTYKIYCYLKEEIDNKKLNNDIIDKVVIEMSDNSKENQEEHTLPNIDFSILKQENKDIVGWIYSENTPINYPIVQSKDNEYYLHRLINGKYNSAGSIFMDYRNTPNFTDNNTIIYGHNMKNNTMFGTLLKYKNQEYYDEHKIMYLFTQKRNYAIKVFTSYTTSDDSNIYNLSKISKSKIEELIKKSDFKSDVIVSKEDKIITLSTCSYDYDEARYIVMGVLESLEEEN